MTRYCCPKCEDHPLLSDSLECIFCGGQYKWVEKREKPIIRAKKALNRLRLRS